MEWFAGVSLALNVAQFAALGAFVVTCGRYTLHGVAAQLAGAPWRAVAGPLFAAGVVLKGSIFSAIGKRGVYYGAKFGHTIPWVHGFPFSVTGACRARAGPRGVPLTPRCSPRNAAAAAQHTRSTWAARCASPPRASRCTTPPSRATRWCPPGGWRCIC